MQFFFKHSIFGRPGEDKGLLLPSPADAHESYISVLKRSLKNRFVGSVITPKLMLYDNLR